MPYYIHPKDIDITTANIDLWDLPTFDTAAKANGAIADRSTHKVSFRASTDELRTWRERERSRFSNGKYIGVPWSDSYARWHNGSDHYAHLSIKTPGLIAFTKSPEHGVQDRQTTMRPGKYLQEFFNGQFDAETVAQYIGACAAEHMTLQIARSVDDVVAVYMNRGITSCMDGNHFKRASTHPCRVYGDSDLGVAYYGPIDDIAARAVVWPERKIYSRLYGNGNVLERLLKNAGWTEGSLEGARIRAIESNDGGYVIPYIDYIDGAEVDGKWLVLGEGDISCSETQGYSDANRYAECEHCGAQIDEDESCCESCDNQRATCNNCDRTIWTEDDEYTSTRSGALCETCAADATNTCQNEDCGETWIDDAVFSGRQQRERTALHVDDLCADCAADRVMCTHCDTLQIASELTNPSVCDDCGHAFRCEHTRELPLSPMDTPAPISDVMHGPDVAPPLEFDNMYDNVPHILCCVVNCYERAENNLGTNRQTCFAHTVTVPFYTAIGAVMHGPEVNTSVYSYGFCSVIGCFETARPYSTNCEGHHFTNTISTLPIPEDPCVNPF